MAGFHGDKNLLKIVDYLAEKSDIFIETGTNLGNSLHHMLYKHAYLECFSCEPDTSRYNKSMERLQEYEKGHIFNLTSQKFLQMFNKKHTDLLSKNLLVWLDAHSKMFKWPLKDEITFFTSKCASGFILIDDFKVPNQKHFRFNKHGKQAYTFEYIRDFINQDCHYTKYYPKYSSKEKLTGWILLSIGVTDVVLDTQFPDLVTRG